MPVYSWVQSPSLEHKNSCAGAGNEVGRWGITKTANDYADTSQGSFPAFSLHRSFLLICPAASVTGNVAEPVQMSQDLLL